MKKLLTLFIVILSLTVHAQQRGDNTIIIPDFPKERIDDLETHILMNFYQFQSIDKENIRFMTHPKPIEGSVYASNLQVTMVGILVGDDLVIYGNYSFEGSGTQRHSGRADYHRRSLIGRRMAFDEINKVIKEFGLPVRYEQR